jgi:hypothetical protein
MRFVDVKINAFRVWKGLLVGIPEARPMSTEGEINEGRK